MAVAAATKLGPYEVLSPLGAGGMGEVYLARDQRLGREVAVKVLPAGYSNDPERLRRFEQEARATAALNHPNILALFDIARQDESPYIVSELLEGETLRDRLRGGALPVKRVIDDALQILRGLAAAHDRGIFHRDLKPENIFVTRGGQIKILDFGLAKLTMPESERVDNLSAELTIEAATARDVLLGTMGYMSPERLRGQPGDARSDLFSFGVVLYEMLSGRRPFHGKTTADTISAVLKEDPPELMATGRDVPPMLERIVRHCLEKDPAARFQSARDVEFDLESLSILFFFFFFTAFGHGCQKAQNMADCNRACTAGGIGYLGRLYSLPPDSPEPAFQCAVHTPHELSRGRNGPGYLAGREIRRLHLGPEWHVRHLADSGERRQPSEPDPRPYRRCAWTSSCRRILWRRIGGVERRHARQEAHAVAAHRRSATQFPG